MNINGYNKELDSNYKTYKLEKKEKKQTEAAYMEKRIEGCLTLLEQTKESAGKDKGVKKNFDLIELSGQVKTSTCDCDISEEEKVANRRKIDFSGGVVCYTETNGEKYFTLQDGTNIPADHVSREVDSSEIQPMKVENNKLVLERGQYYSLTNERGEDLLFRASTCLAINSFARTQTGEETKGVDTTSILTGLIECGSPWVVYESYSRDQVSDLLTSMGFKPGKIELTLGDTFKNTHYFTHSGELYGVSEAENRIQAVNMQNHFDYGVPAGSAYIVDGQRYEMDENGYFHLPSGIMFCPGEVELVDSNGNKVVKKNPEYVKRNAESSI